MPKRSSKPDYEFGKRALNRKSGRLRERESQERLQASLGKLKQVINCPDSFSCQAIGMAAEMLANRPRGEEDLFYSLTHYFFDDLKYLCGNAFPISHYWQQFIGAIEETNQNVAKRLLAGGYETTFRWVAFGHVQRLCWEYEQGAEALQTVEIYQDKAGVTTHVGVQRNGKRIVLPNDPYVLHPYVSFPGFYFRPCLHPSDWHKVQKARNERELTELLKKAKRPTSILSRDTLLVNVGMLDGPNVTGMRTTLTLNSLAAKRRTQQPGSASSDKIS